MPRRNYYQAVIFNLDGVLLDTERITCDAWKRAGPRQGYPMAEPVVRTLIGMSKRDAEIFLRKIFGEVYPFDAICQCMTLLRDAYSEHWGIRIKRGTTAALTLLDSMNIPKAVVSRSSQKVVDQWSLHTGLFVHFSAMVSTDALAESRSNEYLIAAERLNVSPERCLVIEDSDAGILKARTADMTVVLIPGLQRPSPQALLHVYQIEQSLEHLAEELPSLVASTQKIEWRRNTLRIASAASH